MSQPDLKKRVILTRYWVGDEVYSAIDGERGKVIAVQISTDRHVPSYHCAFAEQKREWCEEMELSDQRVFDEAETREKDK